MSITPHRLRLTRRAALGGVAAAALRPIAGWSAARLNVFAAASLKNALDDFLAEAPQSHATAVYAGSAALARQVRAGAPADVYVAANVAWMDLLESDGLIRSGTRRDVARNRLVLIAHGPSARATLDENYDLIGALSGGRLAMGAPASVPAGTYAKAALGSLGLWEDVAGRIAPTDDVRGALALVARGEAPLGVVYATDAAAEPRVSVIGAFAETTHPPIVYPAAATVDAREGAEALLDALSGEAGRSALARHGFAPA